MVGEKILLPFNGKVAVNSIIVILILRFFRRLSDLLTR